MRILDFTFKLLTIFGCWRPDSWTSLYKRIIYYIYSSLIVLLLYTFMLSQLMDIILIVDNADDFSDNFFLFAPMVTTCSKLLILLLNRKTILILITILMEKPCRPLTSNETKILYKFDKSIQTNTRRYTYLSMMTALFIVLTSLSTNLKKRKLTYRAWLPFDYSSTTLYLITYIHQLISLVAAGLLNIACDTLICGLLVHICCQIEILSYRLSKIMFYSDILRYCIHQHQYIFRLAFIINAKFRLTFTIQIIISMLVVCFTLYQLSNTTAKAKYIEMILFMTCMLTQIFFYCWYGNEVKLKSRQLIDDIFDMEWLTLDNNIKKSLIMMMKRAVLPIQITSAYIIPMNLDAFMSLLKMSYSTYNLLQRMRTMQLRTQKMQVLEFTLKILMFVGCWPPSSWTSLCKRTVYNVYTIFITLLLFTFMMPQIMDIILNVDNTDDFADTFYIMLAMVISFCKMTGLLINRKNIGTLTKTLIQEPFIPLEADEIEIRHRFEKTIQTNTLCYTILVETTCVCVALTSLFTNFRKGNLTYREWTPYNYSEVVFCVIYARQLISTVFGSMVNVACDTLICGLLLHVCCQIEILECRLKKISSGRNNLRECIRQHDSIFKFAFMINKKFQIIIGIQFIVSTLVVCSNLYQLAKITLNAQAFTLILYTCSMLTQILIYCWYGNEVKLKSIELITNIFKMEWFTLDQSGKTNLLIIMNRSLIPIEFSSAYILTMNLDSFVSLLKTSYSAYNLLQQTKMHVLKFTLKILLVVGCWPPRSWTSLYKRTVYNAYTVFITLVLLSFAFSQLMDIILNIDNTDDFTDTLGVMLTMIISFCKMTGLLINRKNIGTLTNTLIQEPFIPLEADEVAIRHRFEKTIRTNTLCYTILVETTCLCIALTSFFTNFRKGNLTYREWTPKYNYSEVVFCVIYIRQILSTVFGSMVNVACDTLICGLLLHVCCQIEILECRLKKISSGRNNLRKCVRQHNSIFKFAFMINEKFQIIIGIQFIVSTLVVCSHLYQLAKMTISPQAFPLILYTCSMLTQILIYCWYGNEVKLKSIKLAANIFKMEWITLDQSRKKSLLIIMNRSLIPIEFSSAYILTMNLDSFVSLLKTSYSAYNLLQQMQTTVKPENSVEI
ncbi:uncharacterized protein [Anoplolepis gracilipes]|uniref:uncharacterized protein n=1 Tax=Anoplolepis gracilipes TaxID=354296 RepID=UPI003BA0B0B4